MAKIIFSDYGLERLFECSKLSPEEMIEMIRGESCSSLGGKNGKKYFVVWDNLIARALLVIVSRRNPARQRTIITVIQTYERDTVSGLRVTAGHVEEAYLRRRRQLSDKNVLAREATRSMIYVDIIICHCDQGQYRRHTRHRKVLSISVEEFARQYQSDWRRLVLDMTAQPSFHHVTVQGTDRLYVELWRKRWDRTRETMLYEEV